MICIELEYLEDDVDSVCLCEVSDLWIQRKFNLKFVIAMGNSEKKYIVSSKKRGETSKSLKENMLNGVPFEVFVQRLEFSGDGNVRLLNIGLIPVVRAWTC